MRWQWLSGIGGHRRGSQDLPFPRFSFEGEGLVFGGSGAVGAHLVEVHGEGPVVGASGGDDEGLRAGDAPAEVTGFAGFGHKFSSGKKAPYFVFVPEPDPFGVGEMTAGERAGTTGGGVCQKGFF